jgi:hypothetical protein
MPEHMCLSVLQVWRGNEKPSSSVKAQMMAEENIQLLSLTREPKGFQRT